MRARTAHSASWLLSSAVLAGALMLGGPGQAEASVRVGVGLHFGYPRHYYPYHYPWFYPYWSWSYYWAAPYYAAPAYAAPDLGALDLNVRPKKTGVYVEGKYIGNARSYDGWPRYLWLPKGDYRLVFHLDGYRTVAREFTVLPGVVQSVTTRMEQVEPGETRPPEELFEKQPRREAPPVEAARPPAAPAAPPSGRPWRYESPAERQGEPWREQRDLRSEPARLVLTLLPEDAVAYLDGRFLGSGRELGRLHAPLLIDTGPHVLEVVRPGYRARRIEFEAQEGRDVEIEAELERAAD